MIKKLLKRRIDLEIRLYNWGYPYTVGIKFGINIQIRFYNWLDPEDPIPLIEKNKKYLEPLTTFIVFTESQ